MNAVNLKKESDMATAPVLVFDQPGTDAPGTDIVVAVTQNPGLVLLDTQKFDAWYDKLKAKAPADADVDTRKGRESLRSFAAEVRSEKAAIDKARLRLTKEWRDMTAQANAAGKVIEERLETLAAEVRAPLTAWEDAEKARVANCQRLISEIRAAAVVSIDDTAAMVRDRGSEVFLTLIDPTQFGDLCEEALSAKEAAIETLKAALARLTREEADRAELERLRAEAAEREAKETAEREAREKAERDAEERRQEEQRKADAEKAEAERIANVEREAAEKARLAAEEAAEAERLRIQREHDAALAAERERAAAAEREAQAERDRAAEIERQRLAKAAADKAESDKIAAEQAKREADQKHRTKVKSEAKTALITCGADEETARKIVMAVLAGEIPHVRMEF